MNIDGQYNTRLFADNYEIGSSSTFNFRCNVISSLCSVLSWFGYKTILNSIRQITAYLGFTVKRLPSLYPVEEPWFFNILFNKVLLIFNFKHIRLRLIYCDCKNCCNTLPWFLLQQIVWPEWSFLYVKTLPTDFRKRNV